MGAIGWRNTQGGARSFEARLRGWALAGGVAVAAWALAAGCGEVDTDGSSGEAKRIRGRVTDVDGLPVGDLEVVAEGIRARTDRDGRFELEVTADGEVRLEVDSPDFSAGELPVQVERDAAANVEISVKPRRNLELADAARGGRIEADDGLTLDLPERALRFADDSEVTGRVEVRYALVNEPRDVVAVPGRMQSADREGLDGFGMAEVRFYQRGERLQLAKEIEVHVPLYAGHPLKQGESVDLFSLGARDLRWQRAARAEVQADSVVIRTQRDAWLGAARAQPVDACVKGSLRTASEPRVSNTTLRAARARGLSLIQAETGVAGSFCLPVTPDDDWSVSTFYSDGQDAWGIQVDLRSDEAAGQCGGDTGCKDVGEVELPRLQRL